MSQTERGDNMIESWRIREAERRVINAGGKGGGGSARDNEKWESISLLIVFYFLSFFVFEKTVRFKGQCVNPRWQPQTKAEPDTLGALCVEAAGEAASEAKSSRLLWLID